MLKFSNYQGNANQSHNKILPYICQNGYYRKDNRLLDSVGEGKGGRVWENSIETSVLSRVKQITSPGWKHETSAQGWCTGKTQRDGMERKVVGGIGMGNTCKSMAIHVSVWQKPLQYCKVISLQLIKINGKEKDNKCWYGCGEKWILLHCLQKSRNANWCSHYGKQ